MAQAAFIVFIILLVITFVFLVFGGSAMAVLAVCWKYLPLVVLAAIVFGFWYFHSRIRLRKAMNYASAEWEIREAALRRQLEEDARLEPTRRAAIKASALETIRVMCDAVAADYLIIDSNAWMNQGYDSFFRVLKRCAIETRTHLVLPVPQFDEICNYKRTTAPDEPLHRRASLAISRVEQLHSEGLLKFGKVPDGATIPLMSDPLEISVLMAEAKSSNSIYFISEDPELRIRVREFLRGHPADRWKLLDFNSILPGCVAVLEAERLNLINTEPNPVIQLCPPPARFRSPSAG